MLGQKVDPVVQPRTPAENKRSEKDADELGRKKYPCARLWAGEPAAAKAYPNG